MYFDSHVHFEKVLGDDGIVAIIERALEAGVTGMVAVGGSSEMNGFALEAAEKYPRVVEAAIGYDRSQARSIMFDPGGLDYAISALRSEITSLVVKGIAIVAIGEIGLDFHYSAETAAEQLELFSTQLMLARQMELPVIVHSREAEKETLKLLQRHMEMWLGRDEGLGVIHCFTGGPKFAEKIIKLGYYVSFSGIATFRNADDIREAAAIVPEDRILIETDTPYLAPEPIRGKSNEPANIKYIAEVIAEARGCTVEEIAKITSDNAKKLFGCVEGMV